MADEPRQLELDFTSDLEMSGMDETDLKLRAERAIGEYLSRGRRIWPEMPIARLLKAFERQRVPSDLAPRALELIGADVTPIPDYVAKYNFRVTFTQGVLDRCKQVFQEQEDA